MKRRYLTTDSPSNTKFGFVENSFKIPSYKRIQNKQQQWDLKSDYRLSAWLQCKSVWLQAGSPLYYTQYPHLDGSRQVRSLIPQPQHSAAADGREERLHHCAVSDQWRQVVRDQHHDWYQHLHTRISVLYSTFKTNSIRMTQNGEKQINSNQDLFLDSKKYFLWVCLTLSRSEMRETKTTMQWDYSEVTCSLKPAHSNSLDSGWMRSKNLKMLLYIV